MTWYRAWMEQPEKVKFKPNGEPEIIMPRLEGAPPAGLEAKLKGMVKSSDVALYDKAWARSAELDELRQANGGNLDIDPTSPIWPAERVKLKDKLTASLGSKRKAEEMLSRTPSATGTSADEIAKARTQTVDERRKILGEDPKRGYIEHEALVGAEIESAHGWFKRDLTGDGEWISLTSGKSYDLVGFPAKAIPHVKVDEFTNSIKDHFLKSIDVIVVDIRRPQGDPAGGHQGVYCRQARQRGGLPVGSPPAPRVTHDDRLSR
jgi:hypothetical protein